MSSNCFADCNCSTIFWNSIHCNDFAYLPSSGTGGPFYTNSELLTEIIFGPFVEYIPKYLFQNCNNVQKMHVGKSVTNISPSDGRFPDYSDVLTTITVDEESNIYDSRENCNAIIETSTNTLICGCQSTIIPDSVTSIGGSAFEGCSSLTSIIIPDGVTSIGKRAFSACDGLTSIIVEDRNVKYDSRDNCNAIIEIDSNTLIAGCKNTIIPSTVTSIGDYAFYNCFALTSITIPNSVTSIGDYAFYYCSSLSDISF